MHNLSGHDSHFIVRELDNSPGSIHVIPNSEEKFIAFSKIPEDGVKLQFIDTYRFMSSSLDTVMFASTVYSIYRNSFISWPVRMPSSTLLLLQRCCCHAPPAIHH
jgi:hypothetical protein